MFTPIFVTGGEGSQNGNGPWNITPIPSLIAPPPTGP